MPIVNLAPRLDASDAFADTAAVMSCLDLVVTSDTSIAHLARALGVPVFMALAHSADWRWLSGRDDAAPDAVPAPPICAEATIHRHLIHF